METSRQQELEKLITLKAAKERDRIAEELEQQRQQKAREHAGRGGYNSGAMVRVFQEIAIKRAIEFAKADYEAYKEVYASANLLTPDGLRERGKKQAAHLSGKPIAESLKRNPQTRSLLSSDQLEAEISREVEKQKTRFLYDVEIDALQLGAQPPKQVLTAVAEVETDYDIFISFATSDREIAEQAASRLKLEGPQGLLLS